MKKVVVEKKILERNDKAADKIRDIFKEKGIFSLNFMSSPGAGKTTVVEKIIKYLSGKYRISFIDGDLDTERDAQRIKNLGIDVVQINTSGACHLDADMVSKALKKISLKCDLLIVENVGNLVCPATFDVGCDKNVVILSTPEGDDKVKKYPVMFNVADCILINKIDLVEFLDFDLNKVLKEIKDVNPKARVIEISAKQGDGIDEFVDWIENGIKRVV